jgi:hypothetical protein
VTKRLTLRLAIVAAVAGLATAIASDAYAANGYWQQFSPDGGAHIFWNSIANNVLTVYDDAADRHHPEGQLRWWDERYLKMKYYSCRNYDGFGTSVDCQLGSIVPYNSTIEMRACNMEGTAIVSCAPWMHVDTHHDPQ